jgi:hypothetical protein
VNPARIFGRTLTRLFSGIVVGRNVVVAHGTRPIDYRDLVGIQVGNIQQVGFVGMSPTIVVDIDMIHTHQEMKFDPFHQANFRDNEWQC